MATRFGSALLLMVLTACAAPAQPAPAERAPAQPTPAEPASAALPGGSAPAAAAAQSPTPAPAARVAPLSPPLTVTFGSGGGAEMPFGAIVGLERGYFKDVGIEVDFKGVVGDSAAAMTATAANSLDVAYAASGPVLFNSAARGVELTVVAAVFEAYPGDKSLCWVARKDLIESGQMKSPADFKGLRVAGQGVGSGGTSDVYLAKALAPHGLTADSVEQISMDFASINPAMGNKAIDIGWQLEPLMTVGIEQGLYDRIACLGDFYPGYQITFILYSPRFAQNTQAARNFMHAFLKGTREYDEAFFRGINRDEIVEMLTRNTAVKDRALWDKMGRRWQSPTGQLNTSILASDQEFYVQHNILNQTVDVNKLINPSFVDFATAALGEYSTRP